MGVDSFFVRVMRRNEDLWFSPGKCGGGSKEPLGRRRKRRTVGGLVGSHGFRVSGRNHYVRRDTRREKSHEGLAIPSILTVVYVDRVVVRSGVQDPHFPDPE